MAYKVSFNSGTGHDEIDQGAEGEQALAPDIIEFGTDAERKAFLLGVNMATEVTNGWVDAWVEVKRLD